MTDSRKRLSADAWGALLRVHAELVPMLDRLLRTRTALPLAWYDVLLELSVAPEQRLTMSDLAARVVLSRTRVSRVVDELAGAALVARQTHPDDARSAYAVLTAKGKQRFRQAAPVYLRGIEQHFAAALTDTELRSVATMLGKVRDSARAEAR